jgi:hypothetical protein
MAYEQIIATMRLGDDWSGFKIYEIATSCGGWAASGEQSVTCIDTQEIVIRMNNEEGRVEIVRRLRQESPNG